MSMEDGNLRYQYSYEYPPQNRSGSVFSDNGDINEIRNKLKTALERAFDDPDPSKLEVEKINVSRLRV